MEGKLAIKIVGALLASIDQTDPAVIDRLRHILAQSAGDPLTDIAVSSVDGIIEARGLER